MALSIVRDPRLIPGSMSAGVVPRRCRGRRSKKIGVPGRLSGDRPHRDVGGGGLRIGEGQAVLAETFEGKRDLLWHPLPGLLAGGPRRDAARRSGEYVEKVPSVVSITTRYRRVVNSLEFCLEFRLLSTVPLANLQEVRRSMVIR